MQTEPVPSAQLTPSQAASALAPLGVGDRLCGFRGHRVRLPGPAPCVLVPQALSCLLLLSAKSRFRHRPRRGCRSLEGHLRCCSSGLL